MTDDRDFGRRNPNAPPELERFDFLIGRFRCKAKLTHDGEGWQTYDATWTGRYILEGYAIADEYRMSDASGRTVVLGINVRAYDAQSQTWNIKWLDALSGQWWDLGPADRGGITFDGPSIVYAFRESMMEHAFTRATYTTVADGRFSWCGESSDDAKSWSKFMVIDAAREATP
jgi:hypothetical protein